jgi:hypothetical protein
MRARLSRQEYSFVQVFVPTAVKLVSPKIILYTVSCKSNAVGTTGWNAGGLSASTHPVYASLDHPLFRKR